MNDWFFFLGLGLIAGVFIGIFFTSLMFLLFYGSDDK